MLVYMLKNPSEMNRAIWHSISIVRFRDKKLDYSLPTFCTFFSFSFLSSREFRDGTTHEFTYLGRVWQNKKARRAQCICSLSLKIIVTISCSVRERTKHAGCSRLSDLIVHCIFCTFINSRSRPAINKRL